MKWDAPVTALLTQPGNSEAITTINAFHEHTFFLGMQKETKVIGATRKHRPKLQIMYESTLGHQFHVPRYQGCSMIT